MDAEWGPDVILGLRLAYAVWGPAYWPHLVRQALRLPANIRNATFSLQVVLSEVVTSHPGLKLLHLIVDELQFAKKRYANLIPDLLAVVFPLAMTPGGILLFPTFVALLLEPNELELPPTFVAKSPVRVCLPPLEHQASLAIWKSLASADWQTVKYIPRLLALLSGNARATVELGLVCRTLAASVTAADLIEKV